VPLGTRKGPCTLGVNCGLLHKPSTEGGVRSGVNLGRFYVSWPTASEFDALIINVAM